MSNCKFCGLKAGFLKSSHKECVEKNQKGKIQIIDETEKVILDASDLVEYDNKIKSIVSDCFIQANEITPLKINGFDNAINKILTDEILTDAEGDSIGNFKKHSNLSDDILNKNDSLGKILRFSIVQSIIKKEPLVQRQKIDGGLPFNFEKNETMIWVFPNTELYELKTRTHYEGGSQGISVRVVKGLYYRTSSFKGHPVSTTELQNTSSGITCLTDKNIYFGSAIKSVKIPYKKIITINSYTDGISLQKDGANAKPIVLKGIDVWFVHNLIMNLK
jgi:hypothetical protein